MKLTINRVTSSPLFPGFLGEGHLASAVIDGTIFSKTDPFILLMDDRLDLPGNEPVGGPHPHAGFETVTLVFKGDDKDWKTGSLEVMTAGKGIVHTEEIVSQTNMHILQLWLVLPPEYRWAEPRLQQLFLEDVPTAKTEKEEIRVYSGSSNGLTSPLQHYTPFTLVDFALQENTNSTQLIPASYNSFIYILEGSLFVEGTRIEAGQAAWFNNTQGEDEEQDEIVFATKEQAARFVFYAGKPQRVPIVSHGPFIGDNMDDIVRLYNEYRQQSFPHVNDLSADKRIKLASV